MAVRMTHSSRQPAASVELSWSEHAIGASAAGVGECGDAGVTKLVVIEVKHLRMAHQTKLSGLENAHAKAQGIKSRQWGVSSVFTALK